MKRPIRQFAFSLPARRALASGVLACALAACSGSPEAATVFPRPDRPVSSLGANQFSTEARRDSVNEAQTVMDLAQIEPGMSVADIGAGEGYYTVRLAERVGAEGRVLAQDIDRNALQRLGQRIERERLDNVSIKPGLAADPELPDDSFDRVFLVHMYHEVQDPYAFLWNMWPSLRDGGKLIVVDRDRPTDQHGIPPLLLACEFENVGFQLETFRDAPELAGYYAQFRRQANRPQPGEITACRGAATRTASD